MKIFVLTAGALLATTGSAYAQSLQAVIGEAMPARLCPIMYTPETAPTSTAQNTAEFAALGPAGNAAVVNRCETVANRQEDDDHTLDGQCISAVRVRMEALQAQTTPSELDATIASLVPELAAISQLNEDCTCVDTEIAQAIAVAQSYSSDPTQAALLADIAVTVASCDTGVTAAIGGGLPPVVTEVSAE